jgi:hypothetical protein
MNEYGNFIRRADLIKNLVDRDKLAEQAKKPNRSLQEANKRRWIQHQEILRAELTTKIASANSSGGITTEVVYDTNALAFITAAGITDSIQQSAINTLVVGMKADGLWALMQVIYPFIGSTASAHKWNLKDPRDLDAAYRLTFYGGWTHSNTGITANGTNAYALIPVAVDSKTVGTYYRNIFNGTALGYVRFQDYGDPEYPGQGSENGYSINYNSVNGDNQSLTVSAGAGNLYSIRFNSSFPNYSLSSISNTNIVTTDYSMTPLSSTLTTLGAKNVDSFDQYGTFINNTKQNYSAVNLAFAYFSNVILNDTQLSNLYNRVQTFQTTLNRQV